MLVHNDTKKHRMVGGKLIQPGETREANIPGIPGTGIRTVSSLETPASSEPPKQYPKNAKDTIIDISVMESVEEIEAILASDDRTTVIKAAQARIAELKG